MSKDSANLDLLRAIAVLVVYFGHVLQLANIEVVGPISINALAQMGVLIFFVHTSLVLMLSMDRLNLPPVKLIKTFYLRRAFRIYPLSVLVVTAAVLFSIPSFPTRPYIWLGWYHVLSNILLTQNLTFSESIIGPLWSLPLEVQMYLVLPGLYLLVKARRHWLWPVALWAATILIAPVQERTISRLSLIQYCPCFMGGILAYVLLRYPQLRCPFWGWPCVIGLAFALRQLGFGAGWVACLLLGAAVPQFREPQSAPFRKAAAWIAKYSYGIYLSHIIVFWIAFTVLNNIQVWAQILICATLSFVFPVAAYHAIEHPMIGLGARLASRLVVSTRKPQPIEAAAETGQ